MSGSSPNMTERKASPAMTERRANMTGKGKRVAGKI
jgi:hypothetical protein